MATVLVSLQYTAMIIPASNACGRSCACASADHPSQLRLHSMLHICICRACFTFASTWREQLMQVATAGLHLPVDGSSVLDVYIVQTSG